LFRMCICSNVAIALFAVSSLARAEAPPLEYRKVTLKEGPLHWEDYSGVDYDNEGYALFRFDVFVSQEGVVTDVVQTEGAAVAAVAAIKAQILKWVYEPEIRKFKPLASKTSEAVWLSKFPNITNHPSLIENCDTAPDKIKSTEIIYPISLLINGFKGRAVIRFEISPEGKVENAKSIEYTNELFARHARIGMQDWRYKPVMKNGKYFRCYTYVDVDYTFD
jgi:Gram-negative bacterial TonB protein C-terminal